MTKNSLGRKGFSCITEENQDRNTQGRRNPEAGTEARAIEDAAFRGFFSLLSYTSQTPLPRFGTTYCELGPLRSTISRENEAQASLSGTVIQLRCPLPK